MIGAVTNHLWQSTWFAAAAGLLTLAFRKNRAQVRYWLWVCASFKFLAPFALLMGIGSQLQWAPVAQSLTAPAVSAEVVQISQLFRDAPPLSPAAPQTHDWVPLVLFGVWACGFAAIAALRFRGWRRVRVAVRSSAMVNLPAPVAVRMAPGLLEPGVAGWRRPILLLPSGILDNLTPQQLEAVLAHELCHVRRRDNLTAAVHMLVEAMFWFHPLVWWIGARLVEERERACDEEVLRMGSEPHVYAAGILNICKSYVESPLFCVPGVTGADVKKRIQAILTGRVAGELTRAKKAVLAMAGVGALAAPIAIGMLHAPAGQGQSPAAVSKFEVASIKPCGEDGEPAGERKGIQMKGGVGRPASSPGRLSSGCMTLSDFIHQAYVVFASGHMYRQPWARRASGGPAWVRSDTYVIDARAEGSPTEGMMMGPMLQKLLEDRFHLQMHRESKEVPVYFLTTAKGGPKLHSHQAGSCEPIDFMNYPYGQPKLLEGKCKSPMIRMRNDVVFDGQAIGVDMFSKFLTLLVDRPIIEQTGLAGLYDFHLDFTPDETTPKGPPPPDGSPAPAPDPTGPSVFVAIQQQLGLKLEPGKGPQEYLVIDHVERPSEN